MGSKAKTAKRQPSPSLKSSSSASSEASSSRSPAAADETSASDSHSEQASHAGSDAEDDHSLDSDLGSDIGSDLEDDSEPQRPKIDAVKAKTKLHHVAKTLRATAKKTKTFEVQKLVKKLKGLQKKSSLAAQAELAEQELAALKSIDINLLAGRALITKMVKAKLLPRSADDKEYLYLQMVKDEELLGEDVLSDPVVAEGDRALERAKAKITSSKVLADEVGKFVDELKKLAGIEPVGSKKAEKEKDVKGKGKATEQVEADDDEDEDDEEREWSGSEDEWDSDDEAPRRLPLVDDDDDAEDEDGADEEELMRIGKEKMKALGDLSQWDDLIGSDSAAESDSDDEAPSRQPQTSGHDSSESDASLSSDESDTDDDSSSGSDTDSSSSTSSDRPRKRKAASSSSKPSKKSKSSSSSTFLPSLSTGFIAGRSDDEWSDAEADLADRDLSELKSGGKKERKNRMGQRARKALYEKKYGKNANHLKMREKQKAAKLERAARSAAPTGGASQGGRHRPPAFQAPTKRDGGWGGPVAPLPKQPKRPFVPRPPAPTAQGSAPSAAPAGGRNGAGAAPAPAPAKSQEMHPSWIAKQKQKELMAQVKPQGKKVVFD